MENSLQAAQAAALVRQEGRWQRQDFRGTGESGGFAGAPDGHVEEGEASSVDQGLWPERQGGQGSVSCRRELWRRKAARGITVQFWTKNRWDK